MVCDWVLRKVGRLAVQQSAVERVVDLGLFWAALRDHYVADMMVDLLDYVLVAWWDDSEDDLMVDQKDTSQVALTAAMMAVQLVEL